MAEEKAEPPNERVGWKEFPAMREKHYYQERIIFYEVCCYRHIFEPASLITFSFFDEKPALKVLFTFDLKIKENVNIYFLQLPDGNWLKSAPNGICNLKFHAVEGNKEMVLKLTITIQTSQGLYIRMFSKKI